MKIEKILALLGNPAKYFRERSEEKRKNEETQQIAVRVFKIVCRIIWSAQKNSKFFDSKTLKDKLKRIVKVVGDLKTYEDGEEKNFIISIQNFQVRIFLENKRWSSIERIELIRNKNGLDEIILEKTTEIDDTGLTTT